MSDSFHERFDRGEEVASASNRATGLVLAVVFGAIGLFPLMNAASPRWWALIIAGLLMALALVVPVVLGPLNRLWMLVGLLLQKVMSPLVMGLVYYLTVVPIGVVMRLMGRDLLRLKLDPDAESYWILRDPPGPAPETMKQQF